MPRNDDYDAIPLTDDMDVRLLGRVVGVEKAPQRTSYRECQKAVRRTKGKNRMPLPPAQELVERTIEQVAAEVVIARQWYAVYRALADQQAPSTATIGEFCQTVARLLPAHRHLPDAREVARMAVQSFSRPVALWREDNAPVQGARYREYLRIAQLTTACLDGLKLSH